MPESPTDKVVLSRSGGTVRIDFADREIVGDAYAAALRGKIEEAIEQSPQPRVVINLSEVDYLSSAVMGEIVRAHRRLEQARGKLHLLRPTAPLREVFQITRLDKMLNITADAAVPLD